MTFVILRQQANYEKKSSMSTNLLQRIKQN